MIPANTEILRHAVREVLATRPGNSFPLSGIRRRIDQGKLVDFHFDETDLRGALGFLLALEHVNSIHDRLGSTEYFTATAQGILAFERGQ